MKPLEPLSTLTSVNNLAELLHAQGDLPGAERLQRRALAGREARLGPDHPDTVIAVWNLATTLEKHLQTRVRIHGDPKQGRIEIQYFAAEDLKRLTRLLLEGV